jgi:hypothetical protein
MLREQTHRAAEVVLVGLGSGAGGFYIGSEVARTLASLATLGVIFNNCARGVNEYLAVRDALRAVRFHMTGQYQSWNSTEQFGSYIRLSNTFSMNDSQIIDYLVRVGFSDALPNGGSI